MFVQDNSGSRICGSWVLQLLAMWSEGSPHKQCFVSRNSDTSIPSVICKFENLLRKTSRLDNDFAAYSFSRVDQAS
ncbi:hypothetical protein R1flu_018851 [Riccia fluitans]|uniref:Uncharacterized protein n=1 Tax=Riccia fluitans TaxID=41844 RepID=A0ABD1ZH08_9MARC